MWEYPAMRYYYDWYTDLPPRQPSDADVKSLVVARLRDNPLTAPDTIRVDVKRGVVILSGEVHSIPAKRAAGDDSWDTPGVVDVSNQLLVTPAEPASLVQRLELMV